MSPARAFFATALAVLATAGALAAPLGTGASGAVASAPKVVSANDLVEGAKALDDTTVVFEGEAIGDPLPRGDHGWCNASDGNYAIGIWMDRADLDRVERYGSYRWRGDRLRVVGVFHRACIEHGGDLDIHAASVEIAGRGAPIPRPTNPAEIVLASVLAVAGALAFLLWRRREKKLGDARNAAKLTAR
jgi:hypothetical protein